MATTTTPSNKSADRLARRDRLLLAALPHVPFDGWTDKAFQAGMASLGVDPAEFRRFFPGGAREAMDHFSDWADRQMLVGLADQPVGEMPIRDRVALGVRLRFLALAPHREAVRRTLSQLALPPNAVMGVRCLYRTVDTLWRAIGDRSVDFNFYTKRALLAGVVSATTLYWLDDATEDFDATWAFLDRRIADVLKIPKATQQLGRVMDKMPDPLRFLRAIRQRRTNSPSPRPSATP